MSKSMVREAFVTSVAWTRAARQLPDEPGIHRAEQQLAALGALLRAPGTWSRIHSIFVAEK